MSYSKPEARPHLRDQDQKSASTKRAAELFYSSTRSLESRCQLSRATNASSLFREQTLDLATGVSRLRVREFETVYPPHCGSLTLNLDTLNDF